MKRFFLGMLLAGITLFFVACEQEALVTQGDELIQQIAASTEKTAISPDELPTAITDYITTNYSPLSVENAFYVKRKGYEVLLENNYFLYFNGNQECLGAGGGPFGFGGPHPGHHWGGCMRGDTIDIADLPAAIFDYVAANYPNETISVAVQKLSGKYGVELSDGTTMIFDADGVFITLCGQCPGGPPPPHPGCMCGDTVTVADLPQVAQDYVAANYPDLTIQTVVVKPIGVFAVELSDGAVLLFNSEGVFLHLCGVPGPGPNPHPGCMNGQTIAIEDLPQAVLDYIAENYPDLTIEAAVVKPIGFFAVKLSDGTILMFNAAGLFIHECDGPIGPGGPGGPGGGHGHHGGGN